MAVTIIGHFGGNNNFNDGQTVKTRMTYDALRRKGIRLNKVDTYFIKKNPLKFFAQMAISLFSDKSIIVLLSENGRQHLFPYLYAIIILFGKKVYQYAIGGRIASEAAAKPNIRKYMSRFCGNWVESRKMVTELRELGVDNALYIPNFKRIQLTDKLDVECSRNVPPYAFCTFSRVVLEKGIEDAVNAIRKVNTQAGKTLVKLDIYGPVDDGYKQRFFELMKECDESIQYKGFVDAAKSVDCLQDYYMLLFPTFWPAEGMPGTIIDSLASGLPVIARKWAFCEDMLEDGKTALIYDFDKPHLLYEKILFSINHTELIMSMREACVNEAKNYQEDCVIESILYQIRK